jgi:DNA (cytosine-5)-methyltransferase 1
MRCGDDRLTVGSLFSGIGGFDRGLERAGMRVVWQSEIDPYACAVLRKHWPDAPNHGDIRAIHFPPVERCDVLCGGFPCQDISNAGKRAGIDGERSGLWSEFARVIGELRPRYVIVENVAALLGRGLERVLGDLAALGFDAEWHCIPASAVGAPHERDRLWIVAHGPREQAYEQLLRPEQLSYEFRTPVGTGEETARPQDWPASDDNAARLAAILQQASDAAIRGMVDGIRGRTHRLRCLGNAIVPQIAEIIGRAS